MSIKKVHKKDTNMIEPPIDILLKKADSRYTLVVMAAKRARELTKGSHKLTECTSEKPVTIAINEINENRITHIKTKGGIK